MWKPSQYAPEVLAAYREAQAENPVIRNTFCHATYLINLATADAELYEKSVICLTHNLSVARGMGSSGLILHVGSHLGAGFDDVVRQIADAFERALAEADPAPEGVADCPILIENAAGCFRARGLGINPQHVLGPRRAHHHPPDLAQVNLDAVEVLTTRHRPIQKLFQLGAGLAGKRQPG